MAAQLEDGLGFDISYIDDQLSSKTLTPELEQLCLQHQAFGAGLKSSQLQTLGDTPSTPDEQELHSRKRAEIEEIVNAELVRIRQQTPGLDQAWAVWCEREKLMQIRASMLASSQSQDCMVQGVPPDYAPLPPMGPGAGKLRLAVLRLMLRHR